MKTPLITIMLILFGSIGYANTTGPLIDRENGQSGHSPFLGRFDGETDPLISKLFTNSFAFSDTKDIWTDIPKDLLGIDFVRTFNTDCDKKETDVTYTFELLEESIIYLGINHSYIPSIKSADFNLSFLNTNSYLILNDKTYFTIYSAELNPGEYTLGAYPNGKYFYTIGIEPMPIPAPGSLFLASIGLLIIGKLRHYKHL